MNDSMFGEAESQLGQGQNFYELGQGFTYSKTGDIATPLLNKYNKVSPIDEDPKILVESSKEDGVTYYLISFLFHTNDYYYKGMLKKRYSELRNMNFPPTFFTGHMARTPFSSCDDKCIEGRVEMLNVFLNDKNKEELFKFLWQQGGGIRNKRKKRKKTKKRTKRSNKKKTKRSSMKKSTNKKVNKIIQLKLPNNKNIRWAWLVEIRNDGRYIIRYPKKNILINKLYMKRNKDYGPPKIAPKGSKIF